MKYNRDARGRKRVRLRLIPGIEGLEARALLTASSETFAGPSLVDLIALAEKGTDTAGAAINRELSALKTQLTEGPLSDLTSGTVDGSGFVQEVHPYGRHRERAMEIARAICKVAPIGLRATKAAALTYIEHGEQAAIAVIPQIREEVFASEDFREGIQSFVERREARFTGR